MVLTGPMGVVAAGDAMEPMAGSLEGYVRRLDVVTVVVQAMPVGGGVELAVQEGMRQTCNPGKQGVMAERVAGEEGGAQEPIRILAGRGELAAQGP